MVRIKDDKHYLEKVINDISYLLRVTKDIRLEELESNETLLDSVMFRFIQISENLKRVTDETRFENEHILWSLIIGLRNKIVHGYGKIDLTIIYEVLKNDLEKLLIDLEEVINKYNS